MYIYNNLSCRSYNPITLKEDNMPWLQQSQQEAPCYSGVWALETSWDSGGF